MKTAETVVRNKTGLHARPAAAFSAAAAAFQSAVTVRNLDKGKQANAKSVVRVLSLGMAQGTRISVSAEGADEEAAVDALVALVNGGFGEL
ncbi:HPr family phosphocarrier protein [Pseudoflavonifractor sp. CLA-AP-H29]|uniref:Phosphocarrier protein HPr n=1 Tax=Pseudoflavonifractor intestinihominis TaxID=3133171 RepID=A0ABV1E8A7_9FIRM